MTPVAVPAANVPTTKFAEPKGRGKHKRPPSKWETHQFLCFDGEGYDIDGHHQYVYLCAYDGVSHAEVRNDTGLSSTQCFDFLVAQASEHQQSLAVIFGGSYDANMMLGDLSMSALWSLKETGKCKWKQYRIKYVPRKYFQVTDTKLKKTCMLWDVIGFFQCKFEVALQQWLDVKDDTIAKGKSNRESFNAEQLDFIIKYCKLELVYFEQLMQRLWEAFNRVDIKLNRWDGAGAAAQALLQRELDVAHKGTQQQQEQHYYYARCAYAGGRFELLSPGDYQQPIYNYDINSAYPHAMTMLPPFQGMRECSRTDCIFSPFDLLCIVYRDMNAYIHPYHHRTENHNILYPSYTVGWHYAVEYNASFFKGDVVQHMHWIGADNKVRPFAFVQEMFDYRAQLKAAGDFAEKGIKLPINSLYGKTAQQKGWKPGNPHPAYHQLYWAGWITAYVRSRLYQAMMQAPDDIIAAETDGIYSTVPLDLDIGKGLGQWELTMYKGITYLASGVYFKIEQDGTEVAKYRGLDRGQLSRAKVLKGWELYESMRPKTKEHRVGHGIGPEKPVIGASTTRFRTLSSSLQGDRLDQWRQWVTEERNVNLIAGGKRVHDPFETDCTWGPGQRHRTYAIGVYGKDTSNQLSSPYNVAWVNGDEKDEWWMQLEEAYEEDLIYE